MKLKVIGWTWYDTDIFEEGKDSWAARAAVVDEIKSNGYMFSGYYHQEMQACAPILNDGKIRRYTQRGFGDIMAEAHGYNGMRDYVYFMINVPGKIVTPTNEIYKSEVIAEENLCETFTIELSCEKFCQIEATNEIKLEDIDEYRYIDCGDTLVLACNDKHATFLISDVDRRKDLPKAEYQELMMQMFYSSESQKQQATEKYQSLSDALFLTLTKIE